MTMSPAAEYVGPDLVIFTLGWNRFVLTVPESADAVIAGSEPWAVHVACAVFRNGSAAPLGIVNVGVDTSLSPAARPVTVFEKPISSSVTVQLSLGAPAAPDARLVFVSVIV